MACYLMLGTYGRKDGRDCAAMVRNPGAAVLKSTPWRQRRKRWNRSWDGGQPSLPFVHTREGFHQPESIGVFGAAK